MVQASRQFLPVVLLLLCACGGRGGAGISAPVDPEATIRQFLSAVRENSLFEMSNLWGTERGPASASMNREDLEQRLTVMRIYLRHNSARITGARAIAGAADDSRRQYDVELTRGRCVVTTPFTVVRSGAAWLVENVDLQAVGNPRSDC